MACHLLLLEVPISMESILSSIKDLPSSSYRIDEIPIDSSMSIKLEEVIKSNDNIKRAYLLLLKEKDLPLKENDTPFDRAHFLKNGWILFENKDYILARIIFSYMLEKNQNDSEALRGLGLCFLKLCDVASAKKCFIACEKLEVSDELYFNLAECYIREKNFDVAICYLKKVCVSDKASQYLKVQAYKEMGNCFLKQEKLKEAAAAYYEGLKIEPRSSLLLTNLGTLEYRRGHFNLALDFFEKAVETNKNNSKAFCGMGLVAFAKNELNEASRFFLKSIKINDQNSLALLNLIQIGYRKNSFIGIKPYIIKFLEKNPDNHEIRFALASIYLKEGYYKSCEKHLRVILTKDPKHEKARRLSAQIEASRLKY